MVYSDNCVWSKSLFFPPLGKGRRLKQAKEEAIAEIDHYRLQREKEFRNKQTTVRNLHMFFCSVSLLNGKTNCFSVTQGHPQTNMITLIKQRYHLQCVYASFWLLDRLWMHLRRYCGLSWLKLSRFCIWLMLVLWRHTSQRKMPLGPLSLTPDRPHSCLETEGFSKVGVAVKAMILCFKIFLSDSVLL